MIQPKLTYHFKFNKTTHDKVEKLMLENGLSEFAFLIPHENSKQDCVYGLVQGENNLQRVIDKFKQVELELYTSSSQEFLDNYKLVGIEFSYVRPRQCVWQPHIPHSKWQRLFSLQMLS